MRYYIQRDFPSLFDFDSFFNDFFESSSDRFPPVDVFETDNAYVIEAEVPGYKEDDIKIFCKNRVLTISSDAVTKERENGFITEEIYSNLPKTEGSIMVAPFPRYNSKLAYKKEAKAFEGIMDVIKTVRNMKTSVNCPPSKKVKLFLSAQNKRLVTANAGAIMKLAGVSEIGFVESAAEIGEYGMTPSDLIAALPRVIQQHIG